jgi:hypothetical protein
MQTLENQEPVSRGRRRPQTLQPSEFVVLRERLGFDLAAYSHSDR